MCEPLIADILLTIGTLIIRTATLPIAIYNQRNAGQMQVHMPKLQELQAKLQEARIRNDQLASKLRLLWSLRIDPVSRFSSTLVMRVGGELMEFMKHADVRPWKAMLGPFMQVTTTICCSSPRHPFVRH